MHRPISLASLLLLPALASSACSSSDESRDDDSNAGCTIYFGTVESDEGRVDAAVDCADGSDCVDGRNIHRGATVDFVIQVDEETATGPIEIRSEPEDFLTVSGFDDEPFECGKGIEVTGVVEFANEGEGALVVFSDGRELDRFSFDVQEAEELRVLLIRGDSATILGEEEPVALDVAVRLEATARGASGDRLVAGPGFEWSIDDPTVATFEDATFLGPPTVALTPGDAGVTTLTLIVGDLRREISIEVGQEP